MVTRKHCRNLVLYTSARLFLAVYPTSWKGMCIHACYLVSGNALLGKGSVTNPCSPSHLLGILHSTSQCQHLRASIHQGFNYKKQGANSGCILQSTTFVNIACNIVYIAVLNPNKIHTSPGQPKVWWILLHRPWCKMESGSFI